MEDLCTKSMMTSLSSAAHLLIQHEGSPFLMMSLSGNDEGIMIL
jgi:hypothetical protein